MENPHTWGGGNLFFGFLERDRQGGSALITLASRIRLFAAMAFFRPRRDVSSGSKISKKRSLRLSSAETMQKP
jgi:hypothetical protein